MAEAIKGFNSQYANITSNQAAQTLVTGKGHLNGITINKAGSSDFVVYIYDNSAASGTLIGTITNPSLGGYFRYDCLFLTGLTIKTTSTTHGDITVTYNPL